MNNIILTEDYSVYTRNLKKLITKLDLLKVPSDQKDNKEKILKKLKSLFNKLYLFQIYKDKSLISITGFQGAGKTTLVRDYFNIPEGYLPENNSRGEKLPIFIASSDVKEIEAYLYSTNLKDGKMEIAGNKIDPNEIESKSMVPNEKSDLWIEIRIPFNISSIKNSNTNIVLLPGYEKISTDFSQKLLDFVVNVSLSSILVMDKNSYARKSTNVILKKINNKFEDLKPIIAITHGDEKPEENEDIRKSVIETLNVKDEERVIVTGPSEEFNGNWKIRLTELIENYSDNNIKEEDTRKLTMEEIFDDIRNELEEVNYMLEEIKNDLDINIALNEKNNVGEKFREEYERYLDTLKKKMVSHLESYKNSKQIDLVDEITKESTFFKNIKTRILGRNIKEESNLKGKIEEIWMKNDSNGNNALNIMNNVAKEVLIEFDNIYKNPISNNTDNINKLTEQKNSIVKIENYFGETDKSEALNDQDIKGLVFLGANFLTSTFNAIEKKENSDILNKESNDTITEKRNERNENIVINLIDNKDINEANQKEKEVYSDLGIKIVKTLPIILGIDLASDGKLDTIDSAGKGVENVSVALSSIGIKVSSRALLTIGGGAVFLSLAGYAITKNLQDLNRRQLLLYQNAELFIESLAYSQVHGYVESLRNTFINMEEKLRYRHSLLKGNDDKVTDIENCQYILNIVNKETECMLERSFDEKLLF